MISASVVCDSIGEHSPRLTTFLTRYNKYVHSEHMRHRTGSYCVSSSRAIPVSKNLEEVRSDELRASPVWWGREQKGMSSGEELDDTLTLVEWASAETGKVIDEITYREAAKRRWRQAALCAANVAERMVEIGVHKSIVNRILEPFLHVNVLVTSCEPGLLNFFGLRLDRAAQPEIRVLAEAMWRVWNESTPQKLEPGQWHLPFIEEEYEVVYDRNEEIMAICRYPRLPLDIAQRVSTARCARLSYTSFETGKRSTIEEDLALYERLVGAQPIHASPAEHLATPDQRVVDTGPNGNGWDERWAHPELHGNLPGWVTHRKLLPGEAIAPLPPGYEYKR